MRPAGATPARGLWLQSGERIGHSDTKPDLKCAGQVLVAQLKTFSGAGSGNEVIRCSGTS